MKISAKGRYALVSMIYLGMKDNELVSISEISNQLDISKIYLEQIFSILKRTKLVESYKGPHGGYKLTKRPKDITVYQILQSIETSLFESPPTTDNNVVEKTLNIFVYKKIDDTLIELLNSITLESLINQSTDNYMFYI